MRKIKQVKKLIIHHSAANASRSSLKEILRWHEYRGLAEEGFTAYHWYITTDGRIIANRPEQYQGAHTYGYNQDSLGIILPGDFRWQIPTSHQIESLINLLVDKIKQYNLKFWQIYGHCEMKRLFVLSTTSTACPGNNLYKLLSDIRREVAKKSGQWENSKPTLRKVYERIKIMLRR